jgi:hypothetical protein
MSDDVTSYRVKNFDDEITFEASKRIGQAISCERYVSTSEWPLSMDSSSKKMSRSVSGTGVGHSTFDDKISSTELIVVDDCCDDDRCVSCFERLNRSTSHMNTRTDDETGSDALGRHTTHITIRPNTHSPTDVYLLMAMLGNSMTSSIRERID